MQDAENDDDTLVLTDSTGDYIEVRAGTFSRATFWYKWTLVG